VFRWEAKVTSTRPLALVTGANRGIGRETVRQLVARGYDVLAGVRGLDDGERAAAELDPSGSRIFACRLDIADPASVTAAAAHINERYRRLDVLINNAAIIYDSGARAVTADLGTAHAAPGRRAGRSRIPPAGRRSPARAARTCPGRRPTGRTG
jgi:NAD(P)-dependent dehydrogenase (short-subunit alcohol dehydrogenase family)